MANTYDFTNPCKVTITNILVPDAKELVNKDALTGERRIMTLKQAIDNGYKDYEYLLDRDGNFVEATGATNMKPTNVDRSAAIKTDNILVIVRQSIKSTDRYIQFFATQQKILLAAGDSITFTTEYPAAAAHYKALAVEGEITVDVKSVSAGA